MRCGVRQVWDERGRASTGGVWEVFRRPCGFPHLNSVLSSF
jgi:hypothetical protein